MIELIKVIDPTGKHIIINRRAIVAAQDCSDYSISQGRAIPQTRITLENGEITLNGDPQEVIAMLMSAPLYEPHRAEAERIALEEKAPDAEGRATVKHAAKRTHPANKPAGKRGGGNKA